MSLSLFLLCQVCGQLYYEATWSLKPHAVQGSEQLQGDWVAHKHRTSKLTEFSLKCAYVFGGGDKQTNKKLLLDLNILFLFLSFM